MNERDLEDAALYDRVDETEGTSHPISSVLQTSYAQSLPQLNPRALQQR